MTDRIPPQDLEAERCALGSMVLAPEAIDEVQAIVGVDDWYADAHRKFFECLVAMREGGRDHFDAVTIRETLERRGTLDDVGGVPYLLTIMEKVPHAAHAASYAQIVKRTANRRRLVELSEKVQRQADDVSVEPEEVVAEIEQTLMRIHQVGANISQCVAAELVPRTFDRILQRIVDEQNGKPPGITSGFAGLDKVTTGFREGELIILAARPSMGKTALICNIANAVADDAVRRHRERTLEESGQVRGPIPARGVLIFSLEQGSLELVERLLVIRSKIDGHRLRHGDLGEVEQSNLMEAGEDLKGRPIFIDDTAGHTVTKMSALIRQAKRKYDIGLVMIDYLQLVNAEDRKAPREQQVADQSRRLKLLAKELQIPIIVLAQLNRQVEHRTVKCPQLSDLRESGAIEQDADVVLLLHRPEYYEPGEKPGEAELIVAKNRSGPVGVVDLVWIKHALKFGDKADFPPTYGDAAF